MDKHFKGLEEFWVMRYASSQTMYLYTLCTYKITVSKLEQDEERIVH